MVGFGADRARLVGRDLERHRLVAAVESARDGHPAVVLVRGEPGIGKTLLLDEVARSAAGDGVRVLAGRCLRLSATASPYLPLRTALEGVLPTSGHEPSTVARTDPFTRWERLLARVLDESAAVLVIDDLQWADASSLDVLTYLFSGLRDQPFVSLVAYRDTDLPEGHPLHGWLGDVLRMPVATELVLPRLTAEATAAQVANLLDGPVSSRLLEAVFGRSAGNPYLTELLVAGLQGPADDLPAELPTALREAVLAAWHRLPRPSRQLMRLLAVAGRPQSRDALVRVAAVGGVSPDEVGDAVRDAVTGGVARLGGAGAVWFTHPLLAEVLYGTLSPEETRRMHEAYAEVAVDPLDLEQLADRARHCQLAGRADEALETSLAAAALAAERQAFPEEAALRRQAALLWPRLTAEGRGRCPPESDLLVRAALSARWCGDAAVEIDMARHARQVADPAVDPMAAARARTMWTESAFLAGVADVDPVQEAVSVVALTASSPDRVEHLRARAILALILASRGDPSVAMAYADAAVEAAERAGDPGELAYALWVRTVASFATTDTAADVEACAQAAAASAQPESECLACLARSDWLGGQGRLAEAARVLIDGHAVAQQKGLGGLTAYLATYAAHCLLVCGPTGQAERLLRQVLATRPTGILGAQAHGAMAVVAVRQDRLSEAASHQAAAEELVPQYAHQPEVHGAVPTAEFLLAAGEVEEALGTLTATISGHATADPRFADTMLLWGARAAARLANLQDDPGPARAALQTLLGARHAAPVPAFSDLSVPFHRATRLLYEAEKSELDDDIDPTERWRAAADLCAATDARYETVRAMLGLATSLARRGRRQEAAGPLREAHHLARALEAPQLARQAEQVASAARISLLVPSAVPQGQVASVGPLTPREVEVLRHLVAGRSYTEIAGALFISPKTVGVHVSNLLRKTGTTNRIDAAMWARAHGMAP